MAESYFPILIVTLGRKRMHENEPFNIPFISNEWFLIQWFVIYCMQDLFSSYLFSHKIWMYPLQYWHFQLCSWFRTFQVINRCIV